MLHTTSKLLQDGFVKNVADVIKMGDVVKVKVLSVDIPGRRLALSRKGLAPRPAAAAGGGQADDAEDGESVPVWQCGCGCGWVGVSIGGNCGWCHCAAV